MSNFIDERHNLYVGWVLGFAIRHGLPVTPVADDDDNFTDRFNIDIAGQMITVVVPYPPEDWTLDTQPDVPTCPACKARADVRSRWWWETAHDPDCSWLADENSEPYA